MHRYSLEIKLAKKLEKIAKKDKVLYMCVQQKIEEVVHVYDIDHYKNLLSPLNAFKRVHIKSSFVLTFKYDKATDHIYFYDLDHHDKIY